MKDAFVLGGDDETNGLSLCADGRQQEGKGKRYLEDGLIVLWSAASREQRLQSRYALPTAEVSLLVIGALHLIRHEERQKRADR